MSSPDRAAILKEFGRVLRAYRLSAGLSQEELAHRAGLDRTYIGGAERGERNVSLVNIVQLARAVGRAPAQLLETLDALNQESGSQP